VSQKVSNLIFNDNIGKCGPIFKILSVTDLQESFLCTYCTKISTSPVVCYYITL